MIQLMELFQTVHIPGRLQGSSERAQLPRHREEQQRHRDHHRGGRAGPLRHHRKPSRCMGYNRLNGTLSMEIFIVKAI